MSSFTINQYYNNATSDEIINIYPPIEDPIMRSTEKVRFTITAKLNINYSFVSGGAVIINELFPRYMLPKYNATTAYNLNMLPGNIIEIPFVDFENGREYEFVVYTQTFKGNGYLFGSQDYGLPVFRYRFRTYDVGITPIGGIFPDTTSLTVYGENFTSFDPGINIGEYTLIYNTQTFNLTLWLNGSDCGDKLGNYTISSVTQKSFQVSNLNITTCTKGNIFASIQMSRICKCILPAGCLCESIAASHRIDDQTFINKSYYMQNIPVGFIGCDPSCLTCSSSKKTDCILCNVTGSNPYFLNGECIAKCPDNYTMILPYSQAYKNNAYTLFVCAQSCPKSSLLVKTFNQTLNATTSLCMQCHPSCLNCKGTNINDCTKCDAKTGKPYFLDGFCLPNCPSDYYDSSLYCLKSAKVIYSSIKIISEGAFNNFVNGENDIYLRAYPTNSSYVIKSILWKIYPDESFSFSNVNLFENYSLVNMTTVKLKRQYFSQMIFNESVAVIAKVKLALKSNTSVNGSSGQIITFYKKNKNNDIQITLIPQIGYTQYTDFQFSLFNWTYEFGASYQAWITIENKKTLLQQQQILSGEATFKLGKIPSWGTVLTNETKNSVVYVTVTSLSGEMNTANATLQLINNCTINTIGTQLITLAKIDVNSEQMALFISQALPNIISFKSNDKLMNSANVGVKCSKNEDCYQNGICKTIQGNKKVCTCNVGWVGQQCSFNKSLMAGAMKVSTNIQKYLKDFLSNSSSATSVISTFSTILSNLYQTREIVPSELLDQLGIYLAKKIDSLDYPSINLMADDQKYSLIDSALKSYEFSHYNSLNEISSMPIKNSTLLRVNISEKLQSSKNTIYKFINKIGQGLPLNSSYNFSHNICEGKIGQFFTKDLALTNFTSSSHFAFNSSGVAFNIPSSLFTNNISNDLQGDKIVNARMLHWHGNPYSYAKSVDQVQSDVVSLSFLNENGEEIDIQNLADPIIIKIQIPSTNVDRKDLACSYFNKSAEEIFTYKEYKNINVSQLNMTDEQKKQEYPEWDKEMYKNKPLILNVLVTKTETKKVGDFKTNGCQLVGMEGTAAICQCNHLSDFAIISSTLPNTAIGSTEIAIPGLYITTSSNQNVDII